MNTKIGQCTHYPGNVNTTHAYWMIAYAQFLFGGQGFKKCLCKTKCKSSGGYFANSNATRLS